MDLVSYRAQIDAIDEELLRLFQTRMQVCAAIADYKQARGLPIYQPAREQEKLDSLSHAVEPALRPYLQAWYRELFSLSRAYQQAQQQRLRCGLLGAHLTHSYSPQLHAHLADYRYDCFEVAPSELEHFLHTGSFDALNVTIPYKQAVIPYCAALSAVAARTGSVNTLLRRPDGSLYGDNTDYDGFLWLLERNGRIQPGERAVVLGDGGASRTVQAVLRDLGAQVTVLSRRGAQHFDSLPQYADAVLLVNATPVGMYPDNGRRLIDLSALPNCRCVLDLIYNPARTQLLLDAEARGIRYENGLAMLVRQAKCAAERFTGQAISDNICDRLLSQMRLQMQSIVLIGMPGCGKTSIGRALAQAMRRPFFDSDTQLSQQLGCSASDYLLRAGEDAFRDRETAVLAKLGAHSGAVIATGGGCVTRRENAPLLRQNACIVWIQRPLEQLETAGRPLSLRRTLCTLYEERKPCYKSLSDFSVQNTGTIDACVQEILRTLQSRREGRI